MKNILYLLSFLCIASPSYSSTPTVELSEIITLAPWSPTPCLEMLAEKFQKPHKFCKQLLSSYSFKEMAKDDFPNYQVNNGMRWGWKLLPSDTIGTWEAKPLHVTYLYPDQKYVLSFSDLKAFYNFFDQLEKDSPMTKLWNEFFDDGAL